MESSSTSRIAKHTPDDARLRRTPDNGKGKGMGSKSGDRDSLHEEDEAHQRSSKGKVVGSTSRDRDGDGEDEDAGDGVPRIDDPEYTFFRDVVKSKLQSLPPKEEYASEFDKKYPPDKYGDEMTEEARVWKVYRGEVAEQDKDLVDGWNKTLDILLIFAGLFSAVATAFIIEGYKQLQPDWGEVTARILIATLATQGAGGNFTLPASLAATATQLLQFSPPDMSRWINGMWLCSLALSLAVALLCILVKQWIVQYESRNVGRAPSIHVWARRHALYTQGLQRWHMHEIVDALPALLHVSLLLFSTGLVLFFWSIDHGIAGCLLIITTCLAGFYLSTLLLSYWYVTCPFYLPWFKHIHGGVDYALRRFGTVLSPRQTLAQLLQIGHAACDAAILAWLTAQSPIQDVNVVGLVALGACLPHSEVMDALRGADVDFWHIVESKLGAFFDSAYSTMVLYDMSHDTLSSWTSHDEEAPLPAPAYEYLRACHTILTLSNALGDRPDLGFIPRSPTGFPQMTLLNSLLGRTHALVLSRHTSAVILKMKALLVQQSLTANELTEFHVTQYLSSIDQGIRNRNWNIPPAHVGQILDLLLLTAPEETENNALRLAVGLRFVHWTIVQGRTGAILKKQLLDIMGLCVRRRQRFTDELRVIADHIYDENARSIYLHAMELYCHILSHPSDYPLDEDLTQLVLSTLHIIYSRMEYDHAPGAVQAPELAAFLGTPLFLQSDKPPAWKDDEIYQMIPLLVNAPRNTLSSTAVLNLFNAVGQHLAGASLIYCTQRFTAVLEKNSAAALVLLVAPDGDTSPWAKHCDIVKTSVRILEHPTEFGFSHDAVERVTALPTKHGVGVALQFLGPPVTLGLILGDELLRRERDAATLAMGAELFDVDVFTRLFDYLTLENLKERASLGTTLSMEAALRRLLVDFLPKLAPDKWPRIRLGMQLNLREKVGRAGVWAMRDEIDATLSSSLSMAASASNQDPSPV